jgi:hypothetical protein
MTLPSMLAGVGRGPELAIEIEFDQLWESSEEEMALARGIPPLGVNGGDVEMVEEEVSNLGWSLNEEDKYAMSSEAQRCFSTL